MSSTSPSVPLSYAADGKPSWRRGRRVVAAAILAALLLAACLSGRTIRRKAELLYWQHRCAD